MSWVAWAGQIMRAMRLSTLAGVTASLLPSLLRSWVSTDALQDAVGRDDIAEDLLIIPPSNVMTN